jgi:hypothetical protein
VGLLCYRVQSCTLWRHPHSDRVLATFERMCPAHDVSVGHSCHVPGGICKVGHHDVGQLAAHVCQPCLTAVMRPESLGVMKGLFIA